MSDPRLSLQAKCYVDEFLQMGFCGYPAKKAATQAAATRPLPTTAPAGLSDWGSHGEEYDEATLAQAAVTEELIERIRATKPAWEAGHNDYFAGP